VVVKYGTVEVVFIAVAVVAGLVFMVVVEVGVELEETTTPPGPATLVVKLPVST
jgi:hypothetical protein